MHYDLFNVCSGFSCTILEIYFPTIYHFCIVHSFSISPILPSIPSSLLLSSDAENLRIISFFSFRFGKRKHEYLRFGPLVKDSRHWT
uniref:Ovule protein n=1 Tax=Heterorhabditis bacteriophora TaxID=37862 RepID=A0A1I7X4X5_HETBA